MTDRPNASELLRVARETLLRDIVPHLGQAQKYPALMIANAMGIAELVGKDGCRAAWLIAQHSICTPDLQRKFLGLLDEAAKRGDVPLRQVAMLTDRIRFNEDRSQVYGTVFDWDENGEFGCRVQDRDGLEQRRKEAGLCPYAEALQLNRRAVEAEGAKPPSDYAAYRRGFLDWAAKAGWRKAD